VGGAAAPPQGRPRPLPTDNHYRRSVAMFDTTHAFSGFSVDDVPTAKKFYGEVLGVPLTEAHGMLRLHFAGRDTLVYPKGDKHVPADYTMLNIPVEDIDAAVTTLQEAGIELARFDGVDERGVFRLGGPLIAWFRDPAGNILSVIQES
jgi:catechol 2,3-dioxygenase-like lactoylglutathione lyase family enzyme